MTRKRRLSDLELAALRRVRARIRNSGYRVSQEDEERLLRAEPLRPGARANPATNRELPSW